MATVRNPQPFGVFSAVVHKELPAGAILEVTDEQAAAMTATGILEREAAEAIRQTPARARTRPAAA